MMIELLTDQQDVLKFVYLDDKIESMLNMSKSTWIQWLQESINDERIRTWINKEGDQVNGYVVAINNIMPPLSNSIVLEYIWVENKIVNGMYARSSILIAQNLIEEVKKWVRELRADGIIGKTTLPEAIYELFGFKETARFIEWQV